MIDSINNSKKNYRYKLIVEYDGTNYCGFQAQQESHFKTIEGQLKIALKNFSQINVDISVAGRTDAGVHAMRQVISFDLPKLYSPHQIIMGLNHYLKEDAIAIIDAIAIHENFDARFDAKKRYYRYIILNRKAPPSLDKNRLWHVGGKKLDIEAMRLASNYFIGEHDFSAFRDAECQAKSPIRTIDNIDIIEDGEKIYIDISAKSFLHHMVRNIVGTLFWVGKNKIEAKEVEKILLSKNRSLSGPNAPACGLYFMGVDY